MIACIGDRFDHGLANIHLLNAARLRGVDASILSPSYRIFLVDSGIEIEGVQGAVLSLLPLTTEVRGITLAGFKWPLKEAVMKVGDSYGISNRVDCAKGRNTRAGRRWLVAVLFFPEQGADVGSDSIRVENDIRKHGARASINNTYCRGGKSETVSDACCCGLFELHGVHAVSGRCRQSPRLERRHRRSDRR
jgi:hypothetical protein